VKSKLLLLFLGERLISEPFVVHRALMLSLLPKQLHIGILFLIIFGIIIRFFSSIILTHFL
jgi:hypothetical protein